MADMRITDGKGVQFTFDNGITISIQIGRGNYGDNYDYPEYVPTRENPLPSSSKAELAVWGSDGKWFDLSGDQVAGYIRIDKVLNFVAYLKTLPNNTSAETVQLDCSHIE